MPTRLIREGINSSARVNALSMGAENLYRRLMLVVDDFGRFHASPFTILGACWPTCPHKISVLDVGMWLNECSVGSNPLVRLYEVSGAKYLEVSNFGQTLRAKKSKFPDPPEICEQNASTCEASANGLQTDANGLQTIAHASRSRIAKTETDTKGVVSISERSPMMQLRAMWETKGKPTDWEDWKAATEAANSASISDEEISEKVIPWARQHLATTEAKFVMNPRKIFTSKPHHWKAREPPNREDLPDNLWAPAYEGFVKERH